MHIKRWKNVALEMIHTPQSVGSELAIFRSSEWARGRRRSCVNAHFTVSCVAGGPETVQKHVCISDTLAGVSGSTNHNSAVGLSYQEIVGLEQRTETTSRSTYSLFWSLLTFCCVELSGFLKINYRTSPNRRTSPATSLITLLCNIWATLARDKFPTTSKSQYD